MNYIMYLIAKHTGHKATLHAECNLRKWVNGKLYRDYTFTDYANMITIHAQWVEVNGKVERVAKINWK